MFKRQELEVFSFDYSAHKTPLAYRTHQASVELMHRTKIIPAVKANNGAVFLKKVGTFPLILYSNLKQPCMKSMWNS